MNISRRIPSRPTLLRFIVFCAALAIVTGRAWGQESVTNPDGSTTTTAPDNTYGQGGTKETTTSNNPDGGTVTREVEKGKDGSPMHATETNGNDKTDITWRYDKQGRIISVRILKNKIKWIARKHYKDKNDESGVADYEFYDDEVDEWMPGGNLVKTNIEAILKRFGLVLWPEIVHLTAAPPPKKDAAPKTEIPAKESLKTSTSETSPAATPMAVTSQLVGLVYEKDSRPGDQVTMSLTADPKKYESIPALSVIEMMVPVAGGGATQAALQGLVVDLGDGRRQTADQPLTVLIAQNATGIPVTIAPSGSATPAAHCNVPVAPVPSEAPVANTGKASDFTTLPVVQNMSVIRGPLSGNGSMTRIGVDRQPAMIVAETPRAVFFALPPATAAGPHTLTMQDGQRGASAEIVKPELIMNAGQLKLEKGQSTNYTATVRLPLPPSAWQHGGGSSPELMNPAEINKLFPNFRPPKAGEPAVVLFVLQNASRDTVSIQPSRNEVVSLALHEQDFKNNQFTQSGMIQSKRSGGFDINGIVEAFFAPISCGELITPPGLNSDNGTTKPLTEHPNPVLADTKHKPCTGTCEKPAESRSTDPWKPEIYVSCKACDTCKQEDCACNLWKRKSGTPPGQMLPDWEFEAQQGTKHEKASGFEYSCFCTQ